jgi:hypothetical protein
MPRIRRKPHGFEFIAYQDAAKAFQQGTVALARTSQNENLKSVQLGEVLLHYLEQEIPP